MLKIKRWPLVVKPKRSLPLCWAIPHQQLVWKSNENNSLKKSKVAQNFATQYCLTRTFFVISSFLNILVTFDHFKHSLFFAIRGVAAFDWKCNGNEKGFGTSDGAPPPPPWSLWCQKWIFWSKTKKKLCCRLFSQIFVPVLFFLVQRASDWLKWPEGDNKAYFQFGRA